MQLRIGILTISDRASAGTIEDRGGPAIEEALSGVQPQIERRALVPDDFAQIAGTLTTWSDADHLDVIFTTGGTGLGPRDVTPEATLAVGDREIPGMAEAMRAAGLRSVPGAMLSRAVVVMRGATIIVNLPGSPRGAAEGVEVVLPVLEHAAATLRGASH